MHPSAALLCPTQALLLTEHLIKTSSQHVVQVRACSWAGAACSRSLLCRRPHALHAVHAAPSPPLPPAPQTVIDAAVAVEALRAFKYTDDKGKDHGINVRRCLGSVHAAAGQRDATVGGAAQRPPPLPLPAPLPQVSNRAKELALLLNDPERIR